MASLANSSPIRSAPASPPALVSGQYAIDFTRPLPDSAGGQPAFALQGATLASLMAVQVQRGWPARARAIQDLANVSIPNLLTPLAHGPAQMPSGEAAYFVITAAPTGQPLSTITQRWSETDLINCLLRPVANVLRQLEERGLTHRAIRLNNVFFNGPADPVTVGCAWAAPAGSLQPPASDPPYFTVCSPAGAGEGSIADDVYALGHVMVCLALGFDPLMGLDAAAIIHRKLELGSYMASLGENRLPVFIADLTRGMLSDDPEHRPSPTLLCDPAAARARRTAAKAPRRSQRSIQIGGIPVWTPRMLAHAIMQNPTNYTAALRNGTVDYWLRRGVGDADLAARLDAAITVTSPRPREAQQADALLVMRAVAVLDPLAPLVWHDAVFFPSGFGSALSNAIHTMPGSTRHEALLDAASTDVIESWADLRSERPDHSAVLRLAKSFHKWATIKPPESASLQLCYALNPLIGCESPLLPRSWVTRLAELLPALELSAAAGKRGHTVLDQSIIAFIAVRRDDHVDPEVGRTLAAIKTGDAYTSLRVLAAVQAASATGPLPGLAEWMADGVTARIAKFHSKTRRHRLTERLAALVQAGDLAAMIAVIESPRELAADTQGRSNAAARVIAINQMLAVLEKGLPARKQAALRAGHDIATGVGMLACSAALAAAILL